MKKCPFCSCTFESNEDFERHMDTFGYDKEKHLRKLEQIHQTQWEYLE